MKFNGFLSKAPRTVPGTHSKLYIIVGHYIILIVPKSGTTVVLGLQMCTQQGKSLPSRGFCSREAEEGGCSTGLGLQGHQGLSQGRTSHSGGLPSAQG